MVKDEVIVTEGFVSSKEEDLFRETRNTIYDFGIECLIYVDTNHSYNATEQDQCADVSRTERICEDLFNGMHERSESIPIAEPLDNAAKK